MRFEFATANRIIFGEGTVAEAGPFAVRMGSRAFVVTGHNITRAEPVIEQLERERITCVTFSPQWDTPRGVPVSGEPTTTIVKSAIEQARRADCEMVIAIGGGSVMDLAKTAAGLFRESAPVAAFFAGQTVAWRAYLAFVVARI